MGTPVQVGRPERNGPPQDLAPGVASRPSLPTAPAFLICSRVSVSGPIEPYCLALAPETDTPKHRDRTKEQPKDCYSVSVEGLGGLAGCPRFDMYLPRQQATLEKPVPFWSVKPTHIQAEANMELIEVAVTVRVSAGIKGELKETSPGVMLESYISPETLVKVVLPVFVNRRTLEKREQLFFYKKAEAPEEKKQTVAEPVDSLTAFVKNRAEARKRRKVDRTSA